MEELKGLQRVTRCGVRFGGDPAPAGEMLFAHTEARLDWQ